MKFNKGDLVAVAPNGYYGIVLEYADTKINPQVELYLSNGLRTTMGAQALTPLPLNQYSPARANFSELVTGWEGLQAYIKASATQEQSSNTYLDR